MKEMLGEDVTSEKSSQPSSSSFKSFQSFRKAQKEKEGIKMSPSDVITVLWIVSSIKYDIVVIWKLRL